MRIKVFVLVVALALGGVAAVLTARYLQEARSSIQAETEPIEVFVAQEDVPRGLSAEELIDRKLVQRTEVPARFVAAGAVSSPRAIEGQVLSAPLSKGEQVITSRFQYPSAAGLAYSVPQDYAAVTIPVDEVRGVAGLLKPGDQVIVLATVDDESTPAKDSVTKVLVKKARVLAVGRSVGEERSVQDDAGGSVLAGDRRTSEEPATSVTLALPPTDVERLVFTEENGSVWLALLPANATDVAKTRGVTIENVLE